MNLYQQPEKHLVQFNAGKCIRDGNTLKPDLRKGMIYMDRGDDQLTHFYWKERKYNSTPEDDLIIFPDEAELQKVPECTTGRVLVLKYKTSSQRLFFWMQKLDDDLDDSLIQRVNQLINDPYSALDDSQMDLDSSDHMEMELLQRLMGSAEEGNLTEENLMELFQQAGSLSGRTHADDENNESDNDTANGTVRPPTETTSDRTTTIEQPSSQPEQQQEQQEQSQPVSNNTDTVDPEHYEQLRSMLANMQQQSQDSSSSALQLSDVLTSQTLATLLSDPQVCGELYSCLPDNSEQTPTEVQQIAQSPQFQQALRSLTAALQSGQLGPLLTQLGLDASAGNDVEAFLKAIEDQARRKDGDAMDQD